VAGGLAIVGIFCIIRAILMSTFLVLGGSMKQLGLIIAVAILSTASFAGTPSSHSSALNQLGSAFKLKPNVEPTINSNDITMGYAGQDISRKPTIVLRTAVV